MPFWDSKPAITDQQCLDYIAAHAASAVSGDEASFRAARPWSEVREITDADQQFLVGIVQDLEVSGFYNITAGTAYISQ
jgi:hypothetical protein